MDLPYIELIERLHTAAYAAEEIRDADKRRVDEIKARMRDLQRDLRRAESAARKSNKRFNALFNQVWTLAKAHGVTSIRYDVQDRASRASIG